MQEEHPNARVLGQLVYTDLSIDVEKIPAKIVIEQFEKDLDIDMNVYWATDTKKGLQEDAVITLSLQNKPALVILERVLAQMTDNLATRTAQLESYYIRDLLFKVRNFTAPELGTFDGDGGVEDDASSEEEEIEKIIERIRAFVEPDLWEENGGPCSITNYKKTLLVNAPDFVHRQINGYQYEARMPIDTRRRRVQYNGATIRIIVNRIPLP